MASQSEFDQREITLEIEDQYGVPKADAASSVMFVTDFTSKPYDGDDFELNADSLEKTPSTEVKKLNPKTIFGWSAPLTKPEAGRHPSWANLFRVCGFNMLDTKEAEPDSPQLIFTRSMPDEIDTATIREYQAGAGLSNHVYAGTGATGNIGLEFEAGQVPMITVSNLMSQYLRPEKVAPFVADKSLLNAEEAKAATVDGHRVSQLNGRDICIQKLSMSSLDNRDIGVDDFFCQKIVGGKAKPLQFEVIYLNPDWNDEFNPWELGESHERTQRVPFVFEHDLFRVFIEECQPINTEKVSIGKLGLKGIKQTLNVLSGFECSVKY